MPAGRVCMRQVREIVRLGYAGVSKHQIALRTGVVPSTVRETLKRFAAAGLDWPLGDEVTDTVLEGRMYRNAGKKQGHRQYGEPDWAWVHRELKRKHVTLTILWDEYIAQHPDGYRYSRWCDLYRGWEGKLSVTMRQSHAGGEKLFVDYAGDRVELFDRLTGEARPAWLFVAVMGASSFTYAEATWTQGLADWIGAQLLILADHFRKDFRFLLEDDARDPDEGVEILFRERGNELSPADRTSIAEFAFLCRSEAMLERELDVARHKRTFEFRPRRGYFKGHGADCATKLRIHLGLSDKEVTRDLFAAIRGLGIRVFRRRLENSNISGLFMNHPEAGPCILVNLAEGMARQRFSAAHELGHGLLDEKPITLSMVGEWSSNDLVEVRANTFASDFLMPPALLGSVAKERWADPAVVSSWAGRLRVSLPALLKALHEAKLIDGDQRTLLRQSAPRPAEPPDPELEGSLTPTQAARKTALLERGLSKSYVDLCFQAYNQGVISFGLLVEMLLATPGEAAEIAALFGRSLAHD